ncbi:MAG TPA: hypothetical protein VG890_11180, partial [Puia sp.]|nr:hypothetical protein [Puia sp.]
GGKQYSGLQFYYIVFPYNPGKYLLPSFQIRATTPPVGSAIAQHVTIRTRPESYTVKPIPEDVQTDSWLVAKNVLISERWNRSLQHLKVGDVVERTIVINARGTLPQFIPDLPKEEMEWASIYPGEPDLDDTRDDYDANGRRTQTFTYLLEKPGDYVFPAEKITWWNPYSHKLFSRSTPTVHAHVDPNPSLGILATLKDSLAATRQAVAPKQPEKKGPLMIAGLAWYWFALYALAAFVLLDIIVRLTVRFIRYLRGAWGKYRNSETYWFRKFLLSRTAFPGLYNRLYAWWDRVDLAEKSPALGVELNRFRAEEVEKELDEYNKRSFDNDPGEPPEERTFKKGIRAFRKKIHVQWVREKTIISPEQQEWPI